MFLLDPELWQELGERKVWLSFGTGFKGGSYFRRRCRTTDPLPSYQPGHATEIYVRFSDHRAQPRCEFVPIRHLLPTPPTARGRDGIVLSGVHRGELVNVVWYSKKTKNLHVRNAAEKWDESEDNICWVEQIHGV
jgi:hypothetical protein